MTTVYFIRHAESDNSVLNSEIRPLTDKGLADRKLVTDFLHDKNICAVLSSPYKRAVDTVADFAMKHGLAILTVDDLREQHEVGWKDDSDYFAYEILQWADFALKLPGGESLAEVQERNIAALRNILLQYKDKNIIIGTHGMALSTIINYYDSTYCFEDFMAMVHIKPWVVKMIFNGHDFVEMEKTICLQIHHILTTDKEYAIIHAGNKPYLSKGEINE